jgi:hypothetical protein
VLGLICKPKKLMGLTPTTLTLEVTNPGYGRQEPSKEANKWIKEFQIYMCQNQIPEYAWVTYLDSFTDGRARESIQLWLDTFDIDSDLHIIMPWKLAAAAIRNIAEKISRTQSELRQEFRTATLEKACCDHLGEGEPPRSVMTGLEILTRMAQRADRSIKVTDQAFLEDIVGALPKHLQAQCRNPHSKKGAFAYHSIVNVLRAAEPALQAQWKAQLAKRENPQPTANQQLMAVEDPDYGDELTHGAKRQRTAEVAPLMAFPPAPPAAFPLTPLGAIPVAPQAPQASTGVSTVPGAPLYPSVTQGWYSTPGQIPQPPAGTWYVAYPQDGNAGGPY